LPPEATPPHDEAGRLAAVSRLRLLGTPAEERFDTITRIACRLFDVPIAIVDLITERSVWLKSVQGADAHKVDAEYPRDLSYCQHAIAEDGLCLIQDAMNDQRVSDSPHAAAFRFYAGVPLKFEGYRVGVLCICDYLPRSIGVDDLLSLRDLAELVEREFYVPLLAQQETP